MKVKLLFLGLLILVACIIPASADFSGWTLHNGCWTATNGTYNYTMWNTSGLKSYDTSVFGISTITEVLIVGGGSSGGCAYGGGASPGQVLNYTSISVTGPLTINIGAGGAQKTTAGNGNNGGNTTFKYGSTTYDASRGGYGGYVGNIGGSAYNGGGSGRSTTIGAYLIGGASYHDSQTGGRGLFTSDGYFAGGSGASQYLGGTDGSRPSANGALGGDAPDGVVTWILGYPWWLAGPGGGGIDAAPGSGSRGGNGGRGGGGNGGKYPAHGQPGTEPGAGGGGGGDYGGAGMDGAVVIKYSTSTTDTTPPDSISNLANTTTCENVTFTWNNPSNTDYSHLYNLWDNVAGTNLTNSTTTKAFTPAAGTHTFSTKTVDLSGNMNATWVNMSVVITACPTPTPTPTPSVTVTVAPPSAGEQWCGRQTLFFEHNFTTTPAGYEGLNNYPSGNAEVDENVTVINSAGWVLIDSYITPEGLPNINTMDAGLRRFRAYAYVSGTPGTTQLNFTEFIRLTNGNEIKLFSAESSDINDLTTTEQLIGHTLATNVTMNATDRIVVKVYAKTTHSSNIQVHWVYQGATHPSHLETGYFVCPASTCCVTSTPTATAPPFILNPSTDKKTDLVTLLSDWWWVPVLVLVLLWLLRRL